MKKPTKKELEELRKYNEIFRLCPCGIGLKPIPANECEGLQQCYECWQQAIEKAEGEL
ncbi:hypothetical protein KAR91_53505 [Candidatus Pacearchaeota archaeon]|nr:hypothetical protein [Candidatus Pacearchaeota archaeon]